MFTNFNSKFGYRFESDPQEKINDRVTSPPAILPAECSFLHWFSGFSRLVSVVSAVAAQSSVTPALFSQPCVLIIFSNVNKFARVSCVLFICGNYVAHGVI